MFACHCQSAAQSLGVLPGEEFRAAVEAAQECGAAICFGDRPMQVRLPWPLVSAAASFSLHSHLKRVGRVTKEISPLFHLLVGLTSGINCRCLSSAHVYCNDPCILADHAVHAVTVCNQTPFHICAFRSATCCRNIVSVATVAIEASSHAP